MYVWLSYEVCLQVRCFHHFAVKHVLHMSALAVTQSMHLHLLKPRRGLPARLCSGQHVVLACSIIALSSYHLFF